MPRLISWQLPQSWEFDAPIPGFGYTFAYEIEDFFNVNLDAGFHVVGGYEMEGEVEMTYGFEVTVILSAAPVSVDSPLIDE